MNILQIEFFLTGVGAGGRRGTVAVFERRRAAADPYLFFFPAT